MEIVELALRGAAAVISILVLYVVLVSLVRDTRPTRGSYLVPPLEGGTRPTEPPVLFHSKYCAGRYGSPCNCKGPQ